MDYQVSNQVAVDNYARSCGRELPPSHADLSSLSKELEAQVNRAEDLASRAGAIADQVFGTRPESAQAGNLGSTTMASSVERLSAALDRLQANLGRL